MSEYRKKKIAELKKNTANILNETSSAERFFILLFWSVLIGGGVSLYLHLSTPKNVEIPRPRISTEHDPLNGIVWLDDLVTRIDQHEKEKALASSFASRVYVRTTTEISSATPDEMVSVEVICRPGFGNVDCHPFIATAIPAMENRLKIFIECTVTKKTKGSAFAHVVVACGDYEGLVIVGQPPEWRTWTNGDTTLTARVSTPVVVIPSGTTVVLSYTAPPENTQSPRSSAPPSEEGGQP